MLKKSGSPYSHRILYLPSCDSFFAGDHTLVVFAPASSVYRVKYIGEIYE